MAVFEICVVGLIGMALGSFATALAYRVSHRQNWVTRRSSCPLCLHVLSVADLVPVFSWIFCRGRCRYCKAAISFRYPLIELSVTAQCVLTYVVFGASAETCFVIIAIPVLVALVIVDFEKMILPNQLVFIVGVIGLARLVYFSLTDLSPQAADLFVPYVLGAIVYACVPWILGEILTKILNRDSLGFGDIKFFGVSGLWLGLSALPYFFIVSGGAGVLLALVWKMMGKGAAFPFGPALIVAFFCTLLMQGALVR